MEPVNQLIEPPTLSPGVIWWGVVPALDFAAGMWNLYNYEQRFWERVAKVEGTVAAIGIFLWIFNMNPQSGPGFMLMFDIWSKAQLALEAGMIAMNYFTDQNEEARSPMYFILHYLAAVITFCTQPQIVHYDNLYRDYWTLKTEAEKEAQAIIYAKATEEAAAAEAADAAASDPYATAI